MLEKFLYVAYIPLRYVCLPAEPVFGFSRRATKNKTTKRLGNAHFAGRAGGYAHFAGAGRAPPVFSTPSHQHDARRRRQRGCGGRSPPPDTPCIWVFEVHIGVFEVHIGVFEDHIQVFDDRKIRQKSENLVLGISLPNKWKWPMGILYKGHKNISRKRSYMTRRDESNLVLASVSRPRRSKNSTPKSRNWILKN